MLDFSGFVESASSVINNLTNIVGHLEKNIASYDNIRKKAKNKNLKKDLENLLYELSNIRLSNRITLMHLGSSKETFERFVGSEQKSEVEVDRFASAFAYDLKEFLNLLTKTKNIIREMHSDIIRLDYKLYENLNDSIDARLFIINSLMEPNSKRLSQEKLNFLHQAYEALFRNLENYKEQIQKILRDI